MRSTTRGGPPGPIGRWPRPDVIGPIVLCLAGLVLITLAWAGSSGQVTFGPQLPYLNAGIGGLVLIGAGNMLYLFSFRRAVRQRMTMVSRHPRFGGPMRLSRGRR